MKSNMSMQWKSVSGFNGNLCTIYTIHVITNYLIYVLMDKSDDIYEITLGAFDMRYCLIVDFGLASVLSPILFLYFKLIAIFSSSM